MRNILFIFLLSFSHLVFAQADANTLLQSVRDRDDGYSYASNVTLRLMGKSSTVRERSFYMLQKDFKAGEERISMTFHTPSDVRKTSFLIINPDEKLAKDDTQWIYFPAFRKVRRIGANDKRGSFMGSTFNYSDLDKVRVSDYKNTLLKEDTINGRPTWLIERVPVSQKVINKTGYHKVYMWVDKERHIILQQHYYNIKNTVFKIQENTTVEKIQDIWTIVKSITTNLETQKTSEMFFKDLVYNIDISDKKFTKQSLKRGIRASEMPTPNI